MEALLQRRQIHCPNWERVAGTGPIMFDAQCICDLGNIRWSLRCLLLQLLRLLLQLQTLRFQLSRFGQYSVDRIVSVGRAA